MLVRLVALALALLCSIVPAARARRGISASSAPRSEKVSPRGLDRGERAVSPSEQQLRALAMLLAAERRHHPATTAAGVRLAKFAHAHGRDLVGARAAIALGYDASLRNRFADARQWMSQARGDTLLTEYVLYISAEADEQLARPASALDEWKQLAATYPQSVLLNSALQSFAQLAVQQNDVTAALPALESAPGISTNPVLLYWRGRLREVAGQSRAAAADFAAVYYQYPLSSVAHDAGLRLTPLHMSLGAEFPRINAQQKLARANVLFAARKWPQARDAYAEAIPVLTPPADQLAQLREARCRAQSGAGLAALQALHFAEPAVDAERLAAITSFYRDSRNVVGMIAAAESAAARAPLSDAAADALFTVGNSFWVLLDRDRATAFYDRSVAAAPASASAPVAAWRAAWTEYLTGRDDASQRLIDYIHHYPNSNFIADAIYWAGRLAERNDQPARARAFYIKLRERFAQSYFGDLASRRLEKLGLAPVENVALLDEIPPLPPAPPMDAPLPAGDAGRIARARALEMISLDAYAELEYRRAWTETGSPRALLEAAHAAVAAEQYPQAIVLVRQLYPQIEYRKFDEVPREVWLTGYPLPYLPDLRRAATPEGLDPLLLAGLVRQESAFNPQARSVSGAIGLSQLLPGTARRIARRLRMSYSEARLVDPGYNLRVGSAYFAGLLAQFGSPEAAVAAYNAGEDRIAAWRADRPQSDSAEFAESIPFSQTHDYVQIVLRNAAIYRKLYSSRP